MTVSGKGEGGEDGEGLRGVHGSGKDVSGRNGVGGEVRQGLSGVGGGGRVGTGTWR